MCFVLFFQKKKIKYLTLKSNVSLLKSNKIFSNYKVSGNHRPRDSSWTVIFQKQVVILHLCSLVSSIASKNVITVALQYCKRVKKSSVLYKLLLALQHSQLPQEFRKVAFQKCLCAIASKVVGLFKICSLTGSGWETFWQLFIEISLDNNSYTGLYRIFI